MPLSQPSPAPHSPRSALSLVRGPAGGREGAEQAQGDGVWGPGHAWWRELRAWLSLGEEEGFSSIVPSPAWEGDPPPPPRVPEPGNHNNSRRAYFGSNHPLRCKRGTHFCFLVIYLR